MVCRRRALPTSVERLANILRTDLPLTWRTQWDEDLLMPVTRSCPMLELTRSPARLVAVAILIVGHFTLAAIASVVALGSAKGSYRVDPVRSHATIHVGKAGTFSFMAG